MNVTDPARFFGVDSGMRTIVVTPRERLALLRAARIVEKAHDLTVDALGDGHFDLPDAADLCLAGPALRALTGGEVAW